MATDPYVSPYTVDERTRNSVMAAQVGNNSIREVHDRESRRAKLSNFKPHFDGDSFLGTLSTITTVVECLCFEGAEGWDQLQRLVPKTGRRSGDVFGRLNKPQGYWGDDRATLSLYGPLENLEDMLKTFLGQVEAWANKPKYFKVVSVPCIIRTLENSISEASTAKILRKELKFVGPIDNHYVNSFEKFSDSMEEPILELRALGEFIASILKEGDEVFPIETKSAPPLPTSSSFLNAILSPESASQGQADQHGQGSSGFEELLEAAGYGPGSSKPLSSPHEPKHDSSVLEYTGSPSYSPPPPPSSSVNASVKPFYSRPDEPAQDVSSPILFQHSSLYDTKHSPAPHGTPRWKIDLSERKGHRIDILHVGPRELGIFEKCLTLVHSATERGEECMRTIMAMRDLAAGMAGEYEQWEECCADLENTVRVDEREAREKMKEDRAMGDSMDHSAYGTDAYGPEAYGPDDYEGNDWFGTGDSRDYGRLDPEDAEHAWGYRKIEAPSTRRGGEATYIDLDETEDEDEEEHEDRGAPRDFGMGPTVRDFGIGSSSPVSVGSHRSSGTQGVEEVGHFEEAFDQAGVGDGLDQEMVDVGEGGGLESIAEEGEEENGGDRDGKKAGNEKRGLTSGGRNIGLYGEQL